MKPSYITLKNTICPRCYKGIPNDEHVGEYPGAISRRDNKTMICSQCGCYEGFEDVGILKPYTGPIYWEE